MFSTEQTYAHDLEQVKLTLTSNCLWPAVLAKYPDFSEALARPGRHVTCPFHGGENDFRIFEDALTSNPKSKHAAICTCGQFSHIDLVLKAEGKTSVDKDIVNMLADVAGMDSTKPVKPVKPLTKDKPAGSSRFPSYALSQSRPVDGLALTYLQKRGLSEATKNLPDTIRCLSGAEYKTKGETVYKGECLIGAMTFPSSELAGIIRVFIDPEGTKAVIMGSDGKQINPKPMAKSQSSLIGSAVRMIGQGNIEHVGEGIETMLAIKSVLPEPVAACGTAAVLSGFEPSKDTKAVIVWCDKDKSMTGQKAAAKLVERLREKNIPAAMVSPDTDLGTQKSVDWLDVLNEKDGSDTIKKTYTNAREKLLELAEKTKQKQSSDQSERSCQQTLDQPFQALGYDRNDIYLMTKANRQVRSLDYKSLTNKAVLLSIADYEYWERKYPKIDKRSGEITSPDWNLCANQIIQQTNAAGVYDPNIIRGLGFAFDNGRLVRHLGDRLVVDGQIVDLFSFESEYTYEQTVRLSASSSEPLTKEEALMIEEACFLPFWKGKADPLLFLGWCSLSAFCGALKWRPHLWILAPAGTGKSTWAVPLMEAIVGKSNMAKFDNVSTEAGIRQKLKYDAKPVLMEEAEAETPEDKRRIQRIVQYARNCSTDNDIQTAKGTPTGSAMTFSGCSMFSYVSTKDALNFSADKSRTACIELYKVDDAERIDDHAKKLAALNLKFIEINLSERLIAFISANWQTLQRNIAVFSLEVGKHLRSPRHGDQYGTLLAGYWTVTKQAEVTEVEARTFISMIDLTALIEDQDEQPDEQRCLDLIMSIDIRVEIFKTSSLTIREAINALSGDDDDLLSLISSGDEKSNDKAEATIALKRILRRHGIIFQAHNEQLHGCEGRGVYIANTCEYLKKHMDKTPFANWSKILKRLDKAEPSKGTIKFDGHSVRAVFVTS